MNLRLSPIWPDVFEIYNLVIIRCKTSEAIWMIQIISIVKF